MSALSNYYAVRAWLEMTEPEPSTLDRSVKTEKFTVLSPNKFRSGLLIYNDSDVVVYLSYGDTISEDEHSIALDPGQGYHLEDAGFFRCPHGEIVGLASAEGNGKLQVTEWAHRRRMKPSLRSVIQDLEEELIS